MKKTPLSRQQQLNKSAEMSMERDCLGKGFSEEKEFQLRFENRKSCCVAIVCGKGSARPEVFDIKRTFDRRFWGQLLDQ